MKLLKTFGLLLVAMFVLSACGSSDSADGSAAGGSTEATTTEAVGIDEGSGIETTVNVSFEVAGNSVSVFIRDANGETCIESTNPDCEGFYFTWEGNFDDLSKTIDYGDPVVINDLNPGDTADFLLMYQEVVGAEPVIVKRYPFAFNG